MREIITEMQRKLTSNQVLSQNTGITGIIIKKLKKRIMGGKDDIPKSAKTEENPGFCRDDPEKAHSVLGRYALGFSESIFLNCTSFQDVKETARTITIRKLSWFGFVLCNRFCQSNLFPPNQSNYPDQPEDI